jgi:hypothetical protein
MTLRGIASVVGVLMGLAGLGACYWASALVAATFGLANDRHFSSEEFRLERANRLLVAAGKPRASSSHGAALALLPPDATDIAWSYEAADDSWLCSETSLHWRVGGEWHHAQWVMRYCADPLWREHFIEAAALNGEAHALTPVLARRGAIYGNGNVPFRPTDGAVCMVQ